MSFLTMLKNGEFFSSGFFFALKIISETYPELIAERRQLTHKAAKKVLDRNKLKKMTQVQFQLR